MTKSQIKAELRRSALEDSDPFWGLAEPAFSEACEFKRPSESLFGPGIDGLRTFYLLVAEAIDD